MKNVKIIIAIVACFLTLQVLLVVGVLAVIQWGTMNNDANPHAQKQAMITDLGEPYEGSILNITATDIQAICTQEDEYYVSVRFAVENTSAQNARIMGGGVTAYVDDIVMKRAADKERFFNKDGGELITTIAPGKQTEGYVCAYISKYAKSIEIHFPENHREHATFLLEIPPFEEQNN